METVEASSYFDYIHLFIYSFIKFLLRDYMPDIMGDTGKSTGNCTDVMSATAGVTADRMGAGQDTVEACRNGYRFIIDGLRRASRRK